ncbi:protein transporter [Gymnopus androsaceus JB14]|uniref:Mitochondrial import inner membrane translocase subunit TIM16 n=1 Tax=Gymnopus androsaceus JB14 TaxID=1447944 RepID=A0A6A4IL24_9AGAR|nr:protein transporter [Gymnopus androsaceus JB14]
MSSPRAIIQIVITGSRILGKAFLEAGRQAAKNARSPAQGAVGGDVAGVGHASSGSITDQLTRQHRMTLDEAHLILNVKRGEEMEKILTHYEHLFKANSPPPPPPKPTTPAPKAKTVGVFHSHYLQSKVVRARERIESEAKMMTEDAQKSTAEATADSSSHPPPPPPPPPPSSGSS